MPITATPRLLSSFSLHPSDAPLRSRTAAPRKRFRMTRERFFCRRHYSQGRGHNKRGGYLPRKRLSLDFPAQSTYTPPHPHPHPPYPLTAPSHPATRGERQRANIFTGGRVHIIKSLACIRNDASVIIRLLSLSLSLSPGTHLLVVVVVVVVVVLAPSPPPRPPSPSSPHLPAHRGTNPPYLHRGQSRSASALFVFLRSLVRGRLWKSAGDSNEC
jgi:hypothetical protein